MPGFADAAEQREHFKTDWHRYNVRRRSRGQGHVSEQDFAQLLERGADELESLSGSDTGAQYRQLASTC